MESKRKAKWARWIAALGLAGTLIGCRRVPVWPAELATQVLDPAEFQRPERLEFRHFAEVCPSRTCAGLELTWWTLGAEADARIVGVRVIQLGGIPATAQIRPDSNSRSVSVSVQATDNALFGRAQKLQTFKLNTSGELQADSSAP